MKNNTHFIIGIIALAVLGSIFAFTQFAKKDKSSTPSDQETSQSDNNLFPENAITHGHGLATDVADANKLYIATHHGLLVLINEKDLYRLGKSRDDYMGFSVHPSNPQVFFTSGHPVGGGNVGFQKSENAGRTWKKVSDGLNGPVDFHAMTVSSVNPSLIYGIFQGNIQRSVDEGKTWQKFPTPNPFVGLATSTKDENTVYAVSPQGLFKSQNKGETWEQLIDGFFATVAIHPTDAQILLSSSEKYGVAKSMDAGKTWQKSNQSFSGQLPLFIAFSKQKPETVYLLTEKNSVYKSANSGTTWNKIR